MIVVKGLSKQFKGQTVLNGIDLTVQPGEVVAIIGPSGSGKTTFLRCLNLLETPDAGQIKIGAISIDANRPLGGQQSAIRRLRQQAGFVFQNFNLFPHRTALENVIEGPVIVKKTPRDQAVALGRKLLAKVGLAGKEDAYPRRLSGGQQQRVAIARALVTRPPLLLADEPTGNLDSRSAQGIFELFRRVNQQLGCAILVVTHDQQLASSCQRIIQLSDGHIVADGPC